jgi:hypothetical protein
MAPLRVGTRRTAESKWWPVAAAATSLGETLSTGRVTTRSLNVALPAPAPPPAPPIETGLVTPHE